MLKLNYPEMLEEEALGMAFPIDPNYFDKYSPLYGDMDLAGIQNPKPEIVEKFQENVHALREYTSVRYGQKYLLEKTFPHLFIYGEGGWYYKRCIGFSQFNKMRLVGPKGTGKSTCLVAIWAVCKMREKPAVFINNQYIY